MNAWKNEFLKLIDMASGTAGPPVERAITIILSLTIFVFVVRKVSKALRLHMADTNRCVAVLIIGIIAVFAIYGTFDIYLAPHLKNNTLLKLVPIAVFLLILLGVITPISRLLFKSEYFHSLFALTLGITAAICVVLLVNAGSKAFLAGGKEMKKTKNRTQAVNKFLQQ
ncbi:hypothetical protein ACFLS1_00790 [Verrucomicrobiota bacterium]